MRRHGHGERIVAAPIVLCPRRHAHLPRHGGRIALLIHVGDAGV